MFTDPKLATTLAFHGQAMRIPKSALIFDAGEKADGVYIVRSGCVNVQLLNHNQTAVWSRNVSDYGILGLPSAVGHHPHHVRALASQNTELIFVDASTLADLIQREPKLGAQVLMSISEELSDLRRKAVMLNSQLRPPLAS